MELKNITKDSLKMALNNRSPGIFGIKRKSSVMATLIEKDNELCFLYTKRALSLTHQPGDICFPGGKQEKGEPPLKTAVRETCEELGIKEENICVLCELDTMVTHRNDLINSFLCIIEGIDISDISPNSDEVCKVFAVPLRFFDECEPIKTETRLKQVFPDNFPLDLIYNGRNYDWGELTIARDFYVYEGETIWGYTERLSRHACQVIRES